MPTRCLLSLTTDFGLTDPFVGIMKGVVLGVCPSAQIIDISHGIAPFDVLSGALAIWQAWHYFPADTVHVVVVDPGVGSERQPVLARMGGHWFIAPDNGVLTLVEREVLRCNGSAWHRRIANSRYMLPVRSNTFHGRDIFAPAAAHLSSQIERGAVAAETFGPVLESIVQLPIPEPIHNTDGSVEGVILKADRFGNLLTNLAASDLPQTGKGWVIEVGERRITRCCRFYAEAEPEELFAILGSSGLLEIAMNRGSAREDTGIITGAEVRLVLGSTYSQA
ncbi:MAG: SAM-dependent chlorinase/fluorinase [Acidobacteriaceae bacterium]